MSLARLRTFIEVYRQRSISGAARTLNLTQPAVSQHIAGLEMSIGRPLFERQTRGVTPTSVADELAADIGDRLDEAENALASVKARSLELAGALQIIGHADFLAAVVARQLLPLLEVGVRVRMQTGDYDAIIQSLIEGYCDLGISAAPSHDNRLKSELMLTDEVMAVASPQVVSRLMNTPDTLAAMQTEPVLAYSLTLPLIDNWFTANRVQAPAILPAMVGQDLRALCSLLCEGFGWSALPAYLCTPYIERGELREIPAPVARASRSYYLLWQPSALRQPRVAHARQALLFRLRQKYGR
ncbi:LysR family transcriptional regulator [Dickeya dadantii]|uniref:LysR family transcriptional regulator n=1 Tax=Dickeya dadantii TaxID=204038 RepID=UPI0003AAB61F|nr:LysR family transcriptional regulator [Dickeya dadantii]MCA7012579.1 LysR family transcriptional regulator [Dickeya dadantii]MCL6406958.1 LysR family transcriptional regulator [Dickeya dadantii]NPE56220.1 LysR family transcriptional regulator [Dickeya dadantii]NPE67605.1 LysR family transcriptional regulator [Dickeya dadantii]UAY95101.1 LysR family transcriptional regulator [Dickeya dadantii]